ncbi:MAG TPA: TetR family transcriptional regulator [Acidimicrobiales bacterium]|jgi:AcrR family transcriptional regulator
MARHRTTLGLAPLVAALGTVGDLEATDELVIDAAEELLASYGLNRWSVDDVADRAGIGRTSIYRRFGGRDDLVYAVLARELRRTVAAIRAATIACTSLADKFAAAVVAGLGAIEPSVTNRLLHSDPNSLLPFLTTEGGPLVKLAGDLLATVALDNGARADRAQLALLGEVAARIGLSFILTRPTLLPVDDPAAAAAMLRPILGPVLASLEA